MRLLSNVHVKGKPAVLPDRAIRRQSHYFIYRPRKCFNVCFRIIQYILVHLLVLIICEYIYVLFFPMARQPPSGPGLSHYRSFTTILRHTTLGRIPLGDWSTRPDHTQHSQQTDIHAPGGIGTRNRSKRSTADLRLRSRGQWHRALNSINTSIMSVVMEMQCVYNEVGN
jgi:hypothetical protein